MTRKTIQQSTAAKIKQYHFVINWIITIATAVCSCYSLIHCGIH